MRRPLRCTAKLSKDEILTISPRSSALEISAIVDPAAVAGSTIADISKALERGEMVKISSFDSFAVQRKGRRIGCNPKTRQEVPISLPRLFHPSPALKHPTNHALAQTITSTPPQSFS